MSCNKFEFLISKKIDNCITDEELSVLNAHLKNCPNCSKTLETFSKTRNLLLKTKTAPEKIPNLKLKVFEQIEQQKQKDSKVIFVNWTRKHFILAASFIFVVLASFTVWQTSSKNTSQTDYLSWYYDYETGYENEYGDGYYYDYFC
jgi:predicted anti-sigma-YlaC factor YlaD